MNIDHSILQIDAWYGMDVHDNTISISRALPNHETQYITTLDNQANKVSAFFKQELKTYSNIMTVYEAGGCGTKLHKQLKKLGIINLVAAPSYLPKIPRGHNKNDKEDSKRLAKYAKSGDITAIYIHSDQDEIRKELTRQRLAFKRKQRIAQQQVLGFLRRHRIRFTKGKSNWTKTYWKWLHQQKIGDHRLQAVLLRYIEEVERCLYEIKKIDIQLEEFRKSWARESTVHALMALRGMDKTSAMILVAEVGDFSRFVTAGQFMKYCGLIPSEFSSGERVGKNRVIIKKIRRGRITKAGNSIIRSTLVESAQAYRHIPNRTRDIQKRSEGLPKDIVAHAWVAQKRIYKTYWNLVSKGKESNLAKVAAARELAGFVWAIGCMAEKKQFECSTEEAV